MRARGFIATVAFAASTPNAAVPANERTAAVVGAPIASPAAAAVPANAGADARTVSAAAGTPADAAPANAVTTAAVLANAIAAAAVPDAAAPIPESKPGLAPFAAHFTADWKTINVGSSDIVLKADTTPGRFIYTWTMTARGIFRLAYRDDVIQTSWLTLGDGHVRPEKYHAEQGDSSVNIDFDWGAGRARGHTENKPIDLQIAAGTQDIMSIQMEVMLDLQNGNLPKSFRIIDKDEIKDFLYTQEGPARLRTALGELDTVIVSSQRAGNNRLLRMWFAPSLGFVPVQAERSRDGKLEFALRIKSLQR